MPVQSALDRRLLRHETRCRQVRRVLRGGEWLSRGHKDREGLVTDCTAKQPIPADHSRAGICKVGHIVISPQNTQTQAHLKRALGDSHGIQSTQISAGMTLTGPPALKETSWPQLTSDPGHLRPPAQPVSQMGGRHSGKDLCGPPDRVRQPLTAEGRAGGETALRAACCPPSVLPLPGHSLLLRPREVSCHLHTSTPDPGVKCHSGCQFTTSNLVQPLWS